MQFLEEMDQLLCVSHPCPVPQRISRPYPYLKIFAYWIWVVSLEPNVKRVRKLIVKGCLHNVELILPWIGDDDHLPDGLGKIGFCLGHQLRSYYRVDPPPDRIYTIPISLLHELWVWLDDRYTHQQEIANILYLGFSYYVILASTAR